MNISDKPDFDNKQGIPGYDRGKRWPAWAVIAIPFLAIMIFLVKKIKGLSIPALIAVVLFFEITTLCIEHHSVKMGHWVYNRAKIIGPLIWDVPIEEVVIYYLLPPIFVIMVMQLFYQKFTKNK